MNAFPTRPAATFVAATSLSFLKPWLKKTLRPSAAYLARAGVTANQVTIASLIGSIMVGGLLCVFAAESGLFTILPAWLAARTACATIDGTLAIDFGQKSRLGGILNELGDIFSEIALFLPLIFVSPFSVAGIIPTLGEHDSRGLPRRGRGLIQGWRIGGTPCQSHYGRIMMRRACD